MSPTANPWTGSYPIRAFREFYALLARLRRQVRREPWAASRDAGGGGAAAARKARVRSVQTPLRELLESQEREAGRRGGEPGSRTYRQAQYAMAALADEVFLNLEWEGRNVWEGELLEATFFGTHLAGEGFFERVEKLVTERSEVSRDVAHVYLLSLCLGFEGRYRGSANRSALDEARERLAALVFGDEPPPPVRDGERLVEQPYQHTLETPSSLDLPDPRRWIGGLVAVVLVYLVVSALVWRDVVEPIRAVSDDMAAMGDGAEVVEEVEDP